MYKETNKEEETGTSGVKSGARTMRRLLKLLLWIGVIWIILLTVLQLVLSPSVLTRIVNRYADEYIDGRLSFDQVRLNVLRHFPNIGISMDNCVLTYPAERFDSLETGGAQGILLMKGCGEVSDTLASVRHMSAGINAAALLTGKISIPEIILVQPRIYAHSYDEDRANWNIFNIQSSDTSSTALPPISIGRISLTEHPHIVYTDSKDTLFAMIDVKKMEFNGRFGTGKAADNRIGLKIDSLILGGRLAADTLGFRLDQLHIHEHHDHLDLHAKANAVLATRSLGRMKLPISLKGSADFPKDSLPTLSLKGFRIEVAEIPISFDGDFTRKEGHTEVACNFSIKECRVEETIINFIQDIWPEAKKLQTDAVISLSGTCNGPIGEGRIPSINADLQIPASHINHKDIGRDLNFSLSAQVDTDDNGKVDLTIERLYAETEGLHLDTDGSAEDILGNDPLIGIDGNLRVEADSLSKSLPAIKGMTAQGNLSADIKGHIRLSQLSIYNFAQADLEGVIECESLYLESPEDSIKILVDSLEIMVGPEILNSRRDPAKKFSLLAITGNIKTADISYRDLLSFKGQTISISAKNDISSFTDTTVVHPLGGQLEADYLQIKDAGGIYVSLDKTSNRFQMVPKKGHPEIPILSLSNSNKKILIRESSGRLILTDASIKGRAAMNTVERRQRRKLMLDSLAKEYPHIERDSLFKHHRARRKDADIPEWMKEEDFKAQDISLRLDESLSRYFREWDLEGSINVRTGICMTPYLPLRNILKGLDIKVNNNELLIDSLKVNCGSSQVEAKGSLSGLKRALLGRGPYELDLDISSAFMNADEFIAALNAGLSFSPKDNPEDIEDTSDAEFLKMVVQDSLSTEVAQKLIVIPSNLNADITLTGHDMKYSGLKIESLGCDMVVKERCVQILNSFVDTNVGKGQFEGFYSTRTKSDIRTGFNLALSDITSEKVISMMPAIDTIMPLLKSFKGELDCEFAATASLDTCMNIIMPSINGVVRINGENLSMSENEVFSDLARKLKFKNEKESRIDRMTVEGLIQDNTLEVFPFILDIDRYTMALSGKHNLDQSFRYHVSLIRSPMVFKVGIDLHGPDFDNMKFKIGKPKYKNTNVPVFTEVIDRTRINLAESIRGIFQKGVQAAVTENERQEAIRQHKKDIGYINAVDQDMEDLSEEEIKEIESVKDSDSHNNESETKEIPDTTDEQSGIH